MEIQNKNIINCINIYTIDDLENHDKISEIKLVDDCHYIKFCIILPMDLVITEMLESYQKNDKILIFNAKKKIFKQVNIDLPRCEIYINSNKCDLINFFDFSRKYEKYKHITMENLKYLLWILVTQPIFYYPYIFLNNIYTSFDNNIFITSNASNLTKKIDIDIIQLKNSPMIYINETINTIELIFNKTFSLTNINTGTQTNVFNTYNIVKIELGKYGKNKFCKCNNSFMYWKKYDT